MYSFKQYLEEGRDAPLYHATNSNHIELILKDNMLKGEIYDPGVKGNKRFKRKAKGVSLTRNFKYAKYWVSGVTSFIFELDQRKLSQRYKIVPFNFFQNEMPGPREKELKQGVGPSGFNEYEEVLVGTLKDLDKYVKYIHVSRIDLSYNKYYRELLKDYEGRIINDGKKY
jgi:hypothetical protein